MALERLLEKRYFHDDRVDGCCALDDDAAAHDDFVETFACTRFANSLGGGDDDP